MCVIIISVIQAVCLLLCCTVIQPHERSERSCSSTKQVGYFANPGLPQKGIFHKGNF